MDYAVNGTLRKYHPKGNCVALEQIVSHVGQVASALQYAHRQKLIHRDVKPENMLLSRNNEVFLSDFGLVLEAQSSSLRSAQEMAGTVPYMAPAQFEGRARPASDQYALGIVVYEWLSGDRPFHGTFMEIASQHMLHPPPPLYGRIPGISAAVEQVVQRALAKGPQRRFANVEGFAKALEYASYPTRSVHNDMVAPPTSTTQSTNMKTPQEQAQQPNHEVTSSDQLILPTVVSPPLDEATKPTKILTTQTKPTVVLPSQSTSLHPLVPASSPNQTTIVPGISPQTEPPRIKRKVSLRSVIICLATLAIVGSFSLLIFFLNPTPPSDRPNTATTPTPSPTATILLALQQHLPLALLMFLLAILARRQHQRL
jgi:serine/threonine protein kinase